MKKFALISSCSLLLLSACVETRDAQLQPIMKGSDETYSCKQLESEYKTNTDVAFNKIQRNRSNDNQDLLLGLLVWPGLADFKNADGNEANNLLDRNLRIKTVAETKNCDMTQWAAQPSRYK